MARFLNAVQNRIVEEALQEKEVYEHMVSVREEISMMSGNFRSRRGDRLPHDLPTAGGAGKGAVRPFVPETLPEDGPDPFPMLSAPLG